MTEKTRTWLQISIQLPGQLADAAGELFENLGALSVTSSQAAGDDHFDLAEPRYQLWDTTRLCGLFDGDSDIHPVLDSLRTVFADHADSIELERFDDQDWGRAWLERFKPFKVGAELWICPSWHQPPDPTATNIILDPGLAFGTGSHATTALCLESLSRLSLKNKTVVDYGCGSGILAIAAALCGATRVIANDIDPLALKATEDNAKINAVDSLIETCRPDATTSHLPAGTTAADIVVANILADALINLRTAISDLVTPGGTLLLSGILVNQHSRVKSAYPEFEFDLTERNDWCLLVGTKQT